MKKLIFTFCAIALSLQAFAAPISSLRTGKSSVLPAGTVIEGVVISDCDSPNVALNPNVAWNKVDLGVTYRTAYVQAEDGSCGVRVCFSSIYGNHLHRGDKVSMDVSGCNLVYAKNPERYSIEGVDCTKVSVLGTAEVAFNARRIGELKDSDLYTAVRISGVEFLSKQGSFSNIDENTTLVSPINYTIVDSRRRTCDGWAQILEDSDGNAIYMQVNSLCQWRRNNMGVPKGVGDVCGVLVCEQNRRYGCEYGPYSLRPMFREDIQIPQKPVTSFKTVAAWRWDRNYGRGLNLRDAGNVEWVSEKNIVGDAVIAEEGTGLLYTDSEFTMSVTSEFDARHCTDLDGTGARAAGALCLYANFLFRGSITMKTSTKDATGNGLVFNFSILAGDGSAANSAGYPAFWDVEYSEDGKSFKKAGFKFALKPLAWNSVMGGGGYRDTSYDCAAGLSEFSVKLPASLLGKDNVYVRLIPADGTLTSVSTTASDPITSRNGSTTPGKLIIRVGMMALKTY